MNLSDFISNNVTNLTQSMFEKDILANNRQLRKNINDKSVLVIGGGAIGSSFIRS